MWVIKKSKESRELFSSIAHLYDTGDRDHRRTINNLWQIGRVNHDDDQAKREAQAEPDGTAVVSQPASWSVGARPDADLIGRSSRRFRAGERGFPESVTDVTRASSPSSCCSPVSRE